MHERRKCWNICGREVPAPAVELDAPKAAIETWLLEKCRQDVVTRIQSNSSGQRNPDGNLRRPIPHHQIRCYKGLFVRRCIHSTDENLGQIAADTPHLQGIRVHWTANAKNRLVHLLEPMPRCSVRKWQSGAILSIRQCWPVTIRLYRPWLGRVLEMLPKTIRRIAVLEQDAASDYKVGPGLLDLLTSLNSGIRPTAPSVVGYQLGELEPAPFGRH